MMFFEIIFIAISLVFGFMIAFLTMILLHSLLSKFDFWETNVEKIAVVDECLN